MQPEGEDKARIEGRKKLSLAFCDVGLKKKTPMIHSCIPYKGEKGKRKGGKEEENLFPPYQWSGRRGPQSLGRHGG